MSLHPSANIAGNHAGTGTATGTTTGTATGNSSRICLMGCEASASELRRFPVHDVNRCNFWLRHFGVSEQLVKELGGLKKLRICFRHFSERQAMAKTRIKTTPLRGGNNTTKHNITTTTTTAAAVEAATTTTTRIHSAAAATTIGKPMADSTTIELIDSCSGDSQKHTKQKQSVTTITPVPVPVAVPIPIPVPIPQRSHSICSSSSVSSINSDYEASMPLSALVAAHGQNGMAKTTSNGLAKKRKLYLITEKSDEKNGNGEKNGKKKRKMFVVVEQEKDTAAKKLMIVTDKSKANLTQHLEKFLPEILSCIQDKEQAEAKAKAKGHATIKLEPTTTTTSATSITQKPHITLPPKKNPTNFVKLETGVTLPASVAILPVKVKEKETAKETEKETETEIQTETETETNINLSPDFRFLMKILPKLEQLPEPHKQNVKRSIQIFVEESYSHYGKKN
ncbi:hypothetical protein ACLKA6_019205 [Drosophila palustris]